MMYFYFFFVDLYFDVSRPMTESSITASNGGVLSIIFYGVRVVKGIISTNKLF